MQKIFLFFFLNVRQITLLDTFVVVHEDGRNVDAVGAGHAVLAVVAGDGVVTHDFVGDAVEELLLLVGQLLQRGVGAQVLLEVFHIGHAAQHRQHTRE